jgi:hypothetical protein
MLRNDVMHEIEKLSATAPPIMADVHLSGRHLRYTNFAAAAVEC